jgi:hypothetical protein
MLELDHSFIYADGPRLKLCFRVSFSCYFGKNSQDPHSLRFCNLLTKSMSILSSNVALCCHCSIGSTLFPAMNLIPVFIPEKIVHSTSFVSRPEKSHLYLSSASPINTAFQLREFSIDFLNHIQDFIKLQETRVLLINVVSKRRNCSTVILERLTTINNVFPPPPRNECKESHIRMLITIKTHLSKPFRENNTCNC